MLKEIVRTDGYVFSPSALPKLEIRRDWDKLIAAEEGKLSRARDAYLEGVFQMDEYDAAKKAVQANIAKLKRRRDAEREGSGEEHTVDIAAYHNKVMAALEIVEDASVDIQARNEALRSILEKIVFNKPQGNFDFYFVP